MRQPTQLASGFIVHLGFAVALVWVLADTALPPRPTAVTAALVWAPGPGFSGGGLGGDGERAAPARRRPVVRSAPRFTLPHIPATSGSVELPGAVTVLHAAAAEGTGTDDGPMRGRGEGVDGPGSGPRTGPGSGPGKGPFQDGAPGVTSPRVLFDKRPEYTPEAVHARIQGKILIEATVLPDGTVGVVRVVRSLDRSLGLDRKAIDAVRAWRFRPGTYLGKPAAVNVLIEVSFTLR